jgi:Flp pilus assembly protein TadD
MLELQPEEARLLLNIALMAVGQNRFQSAETILSALERWRPNDPSLAAARAVFFISAQDFQGAIDYIDRIGLVKCPDSAMLLAFKGMAYLRMDRPNDAREPLTLAAAQTADPAAAKLAKDLLP